MQKQNINNQENAFQISHEREVVSYPAPKIFLKPFIVANAIVLTMTPMSRPMSYNPEIENIVIEQGNNDDFSSYPVVALQYENGKVTNSILTLDENRIPIQISSDIKENMAEVKFQQVVDDLREENAVLRNRLKNSLPVHTLTYMVINSIVATFSLTLLLIRFLLNIYIIDPYYLVCALIISVGLFSTACVSLKDWKDNLLNENDN